MSHSRSPRSWLNREGLEQDGGGDVTGVALPCRDSLPSAVGTRSEPVSRLRAKVHRQVVLQLNVDLGKIIVHPHVR